MNESFFLHFLLKFLALCRPLKSDFVYTRSVTSYKCLLLLSDHFSFPTAFVKRVLEIWIYLPMKIFQNAVLTLVKRLITNSVKKLYYTCLYKMIFFIDCLKNFDDFSLVVSNYLVFKGTKMGGPPFTVCIEQQRNAQQSFSN